MATAQRQRGFTFIEILATLTLVTIVLPTIMSGISLSLSAAEFSKRQAEASALAQSKMGELLAQNQWEQATMSGDFAPGHPLYTWKAAVSDWDGVLQQLDVTVLWRQRERDRSVTLSTLVNPSAEATP